MSKDLLHRRMMMQAGGGDGWTYGKKYAIMSSTDTTIIDDPNYALSPYYPFNGTNVYFMDNMQNVSCLRQFLNDTCTDYWTARSTWRYITLTGTIDSLRLCAYIPNMQNMALAYLPVGDYASAYFMYKGANVPPLYSESYNDVINYYFYATTRMFQVSIDMCGTYLYIPLDTSVLNFNQITIYTGAANNTCRIFEFGETYNYLDYWGFIANAERNLNLKTTTRYLLLSVLQSQIDITYIKYRSTGQYIWKGNNV